MLNILVNPVLHFFELVFRGWSDGSEGKSTTTLPVTQIQFPSPILGGPKMPVILIPGTQYYLLGSVVIHAHA